MADRDARLITKRTSVPGKIPTGTTGVELNFVKTGELASNLADKKLFGFDGTDVFEYGSDSYLNQTGGTISGNFEVTGSLSASTIFSGSTDVETIIRNLITSDSHTFVQPGSNIITGGTSGAPIISVVDSPSFNNITYSGTSTGGNSIATNVSGTTFYSGSTDLSLLFAPIGGGSGEVNTASNVGGEVGLFKVKVGDDLQFRTLSAGTNITITTGDSVVSISGPAGSGEVNTASNVGGEIGVFSQKIGVDFQFKTLSAGTNVAINELGNVIGISASGGDPELINLNSNYTALTTDHTLNCTANTFTVTLPTAIGVKGKIYTVVKSGDGEITMNTTNSQTINDSISIIIKRQYLSRQVQSNGSDWIII